MKQLIISIALCISTFANAASLTDLVGSWTGTRTEIYRGTPITVTQTNIFRKYKKTGIRANSQLFIPGTGIVYGSGIYAPGGRYEGSATFRGQALSVSSGRWRIRGNTLAVTAVTRDVTGAYRGKATYRLISKKRFIFVSTLSNGARITGTFRRK